MAQKDQDLIRKRAPHVDIVCGPGQLSQLPELIDEVRRSGAFQLAISLGRADASRHEVSDSFESYDPLREPAMRPNAFQAYVRTQFGCDKFCTYCIVPSVRGPEQSRSPEHILAEIRQLADQGCREITLVGQTVNSYRYQYGDGRRARLSDLLAMIHDVPGVDRIKFVTNFPRDMSDDLLDATRELPKVCKYFHVPAQSGCDEMLQRMKRMYSVAFYHDMLDRCREKVPGVAISSDFIVGFCGETEASFQRSCDLVRDAGFKNSFIFKYSPRPGTKADDLYPDDVPEDVKRRRNNDLLAIQNAASLADHRNQIGARVRVLVEGPGKKFHTADDDHRMPQLTGRTLTDHIVVFEGPERLIGKFVDVRIDDASSFTLFGTVEMTDGNVATEEIAERVPIATDRRRLGLPLI
jgi:tRNA-2-methylthio-N6-dimethylallyladenosine synthase